MGGYSKTGPLNSVETLKLKSPKVKWQTSGKLPISVFASGCASIGKDIFIAGGVVDDEEVNTVIAYNNFNNTTTYKSKMNECRSQFPLVALGYNLYAIGGRNSTDGVLCSVERYSVQDDTWVRVCSMVRSRAGATAVPHEGQIWVFGGRAHCHSPDQVLDWGEVFDPLLNQWNLLNDGPPTRSYGTAVIL